MNPRRAVGNEICGLGFEQTPKLALVLAQKVREFRRATICGTDGDLVARDLKPQAPSHGFEIHVVRAHTSKAPTGFFSLAGGFES